MSDRDPLTRVTELSAWVSRRAGSASEESTPSAAEPVDEESARSAALRMLGRRGASRLELDRSLAKREFDPDLRATVLDRLEREGYLDDTQLARDEAERLRDRKQLGERGIAAALRQRGLDPSQLEEPDRDDELRRAVDAAAARRLRMGSLDAETAERRLTGWLQRRGFGATAVRIAIERSRPRGPRFR